eukprot:365982-Chlamydomonas_euryale.AAC.4
MLRGGRGDRGTKKKRLRGGRGGRGTEQMLRGGIQECAERRGHPGACGTSGPSHMQQTSVQSQEDKQEARTGSRAMAPTRARRRPAPAAASAAAARRGVWGSARMSSHGWTRAALSAAAATAPHATATATTAPAATPGSPARGAASPPPPL